MQAHGMAPTSIKTLCDRVKNLSNSLCVNLGSVTETDLINWAADRKWMPETRRGNYSAYRKFFSFTATHGLTPENPAKALPKVKIPKPMARAIPDHLLLETIHDSDIEDRTRLILIIAAETGARRAEIAQINRGDFLYTDAGWTLILHGKGGKDRQVPLTDRLAGEVMQAMVCNQWLLPSPTSATGHLSASHVGKIASQALPVGWTLHTLRHRFATVGNDRTADLAALQYLLGHESLATTQRYVCVSNSALRRVIDATPLKR
jgi:site-specific recombinase XerD